MNASARTDRGSVGEFTALLDDSQGNRLAEFLLQKHGGPKRPRRVFEKCQTNRFSIDIRTEPVNQEETSNELQGHNYQKRDSLVQKGKDQLHDVSSGKCSKETESHNEEKANNKIQAEFSGIVSSKISQKDAPGRNQVSVGNRDQDNLADLENLLLETPTAADKLRDPSPQENQVEQSLHNEAVQAIEPLPSSPKPSPIRLKNLVIPSSDRLRRNSLKFLSYITGRRTLLKEFENTVTDSNFMPFVCSTPLTPSIAQKQSNKTNDATLVSIKTTQKGNEELASSLPKQDRESKISREVCDEVASHERMAPPLPKKDPESKISQNHEVCDEEASHGKNNPNSEVENESDGPHTFVIRKNLDKLPRTNGSKCPTTCFERVVSVRNTTPTQFDVLKDQSNLPDILIASPKVMQKSKKSVNRSKPSRIPRFTPNKLQVKMCPADPGNTSAKVSPVQKPSAVFQLEVISDKDDEIEIPETQQPQTVETNQERLTENQRRQEAGPAIIHRTFTMSPQSRRLSQSSVNNYNKSEKHHGSSSAAIANKTKEKSQKEKLRALSRSPTKSPRIPDVDDLRFCDILSEEEEREEEIYMSSLGGITSVNASVANRSSVPLNLAANQTDYTQCVLSPAETRRLRRGSRRQLKNTKRTQAKTKIGPPQAHVMVTRRTSVRRTKIPMNAAPCTPINGEPFATEIKNHLARLNNHEILDLRLRNSMGEVFPISGRRMSTSAAKQALEQKEQLEKELQFEILKRNLDDDFQKIIGGNEIGTGDERQPSEEFWYEIMPAPHGYRDEPSKHQQTMQTELIPAGVMISSSNENVVQNNSKRKSKSTPRETSISARITQRRRTQLDIVSQTEIDGENLFKIPPAPGFRDDAQTASVNLPGLQMEGNEHRASLMHDSLLEEVTFRPTSSNNVTGINSRSRRGRSTQSKKSMPDVLKKYMDIQNQLGHSKMRRTSTKSKRNLYSGGSDTSNESIRNVGIDDGDKISDSEIATEKVENGLASYPALPEPVAALPESFVALIEPVAALIEPVAALIEPVVASPKPVAASLEPVAASPEPVAASPEPVAASPEPVAASPEPVAALPESGPVLPIQVSALSESVQAKPVSPLTVPVPDLPEQVPALAAPVAGVPEPFPASPVEKAQDKSILEMAGSSLPGKRSSDNFKKPQTPSQNKPRRTVVRRKRIAVELNIPSSTMLSSEGTNSSNQDSDETTTLRRSKRGPKPFKNYWSFRSTDPTPPYDFSIFYKKREEQKELRSRNKTSSSSTTASGQTTDLSSSSGISQNTNTHKRENPRKRKPRKRNGSADSKSLSSDSTAAVTQPKRLSVIAEFESSTKNTNVSHTNVSPQTELRQDLGNNRFNRLDEVDISFAATHKVSRTPLRSNQSRVSEEQLPNQRNIPQKKRKEEANENEVESAKVKPNQNQNKKGTKSKTSSRSKRKKASSDEVEHVTKNDVENTVSSVERSNNIIVQSSTAAHINSILDQLAQVSRQSDSDQNQNKNKTAEKSHLKKLRVRLTRLKSREANHAKLPSDGTTTAPSETTTSPSSVATYFSATTGTIRNEINEGTVHTTNNNNSNNNNNNTASTVNTDIDAPSWLRDISYVGSKILKEKEKKIFEDMHCSIPGNLVLKQVDGLDYAYYGNNKDIPFGYIRFKPKQVKPVKKARMFHLTFFVLSGLFRICTNKDQADFGAGAVITIRIGSRYSIENLTDKMAILMVFKKS